MNKWKYDWQRAIMGQDWRPLTKMHEKGMRTEKIIDKVKRWVIRFSRRLCWLFWEWATIVQPKNTVEFKVATSSKRPADEELGQLTQGIFRFSLTKEGYRTPMGLQVVTRIIIRGGGEGQK